MCMKRLLIVLFFSGLMIPTVVLAGGIVTNANQSAAYVRMLARDASTSIDAVYYNPAGLTKLADGFHISLSNQSIFQKKTIENSFTYLNEHKYVGDVAAPLFPDFYAVYKKGKLALGFGFTPSAGGGSAEYKTGLPSFEIPVSMLVPALNIPMGVTKYSADVLFKGTSVFWGAQINGSYAINDMISLSLGARMIIAKNTYSGYLKNIMINPGGGPMTLANPFFTGIGNTPLANKTANINVDAEQKGTAFTPIVGTNLTFGEKLNIGIKYEFQTNLTLTNSTKEDGTGLYSDGLKSRSDIPAILAFGIGYKALEKMRISAGLHYYFDKNATMEYYKKNTLGVVEKLKKTIDGNLYEIALGGELDITDKVLISAGYLYAKTGVGGGYQTDFSHSLTSNTVGFGGAFKVTEKMQINLGMLYTMYSSDSKTITYPEYGGLTAQESYNRTNIDFSIGVDYHF